MTGLVAPHAAHAAPCAFTDPVVVAQVGDTQLNLMKRLGRALRDDASKKLVLVFRTSGSCTNIDQIYNQTPIAAATVMQYIPSLTEDPAWTPASPTLTCELPAAKVPDIANSALFNSACPSGQVPPPTNVRLAEGPAQAYVMAVPQASTQTAITYQEAYFVFGFGQAGMVAPWINEAELFIRTVTKSTLLAWSANISVPPDKWHGTRFDGSPMVANALKTAIDPEAALGILGAEVYDNDRANLNALAFRARGQYAAYYPDSTSTTTDKQNVRDGHYTVWSPTIWMDTIANAQPTNANARYVIDLITGAPTTPAPAFDTTTIIAAVGLVPDCAMRVSRTFEGGPLSRYTPAQSCSCKYESLVADPDTTCTQCTGTGQGTCAAGVCRAGFCEVQ